MKLNKKRFFTLIVLFLATLAFSAATAVAQQRVSLTVSSAIA
jgi:molybdate transport system substrate-binding protein